MSSDVISHSSLHCSGISAHSTMIALGSMNCIHMVQPIMICLKIFLTIPTGIRMCLWVILFNVVIQIHTLHCYKVTIWTASVRGSFSPFWQLHNYIHSTQLFRFSIRIGWRSQICWVFIFEITYTRPTSQSMV